MNNDADYIEARSKRVVSAAVLQRLHKMAGEFRREWELQDKVWAFTWRVPLVVAFLASVAWGLVYGYCAWQMHFGARKVFVTQFIPHPYYLMNLVRSDSPSARGAALARYRAGVVEKILDATKNDFWAPIDQYGTSGAVLMLLRIRPDGSILEAEILSYSGSPQADLAACNAVKRATPFGKFPDELKEMDDIRMVRWISLNYGNQPIEKLIPEHIEMVSSACPQ